MPFIPWLAEIVLAAMTTLAPGPDHTELSEAIAVEVAAEAPLFEEDEERVKTALLVVAVTFRESSFRMNAVSATNDHCAAQIHGRPDLARDARACIRVAIGMLRRSIAMCGIRNALGVYATGTCRSARGKRISRDRMAIAKRLVAELAP